MEEEKQYLCDECGGHYIPNVTGYSTICPGCLSDLEGEGDEDDDFEDEVVRCPHCGEQLPIQYWGAVSDYCPYCDNW